MLWENKNLRFAVAMIAAIFCLSGISFAGDPIFPTEAYTPIRASKPVAIQNPKPTNAENYLQPTVLTFTEKPDPKNPNHRPPLAVFPPAEIGVELPLVGTITIYKSKDGKSMRLNYNLSVSKTATGTDNSGKPIVTATFSGTLTGSLKISINIQNGNPVYTLDKDMRKMVFTQAENWYSDTNKGDKKLTARFDIEGDDLLGFTPPLGLTYKKKSETRDDQYTQYQLDSNNQVIMTRLVVNRYTDSFDTEGNWSGRNGREERLTTDKTEKVFEEPYHSQILVWKNAGGTQQATSSVFILEYVNINDTLTKKVQNISSSVIFKESWKIGGSTTEVLDLTKVTDFSQRSIKENIYAFEFDGVDARGFILQLRRSREADEKNVFSKDGELTFEELKEEIQVLVRNSPDDPELSLSELTTNDETASYILGNKILSSPVTVTNFSHAEVYGSRENTVSNSSHILTYNEAQELIKELRSYNYISFYPDNPSLELKNQVKENRTEYLVKELQEDGHFYEKHFRRQTSYYQNERNSPNRLNVFYEEFQGGNQTIANLLTLSWYSDWRLFEGGANPPFDPTLSNENLIRAIKSRIDEYWRPTEAAFGPVLDTAYPSAIENPDDGGPLPV